MYIIKESCVNNWLKKVSRFSLVVLFSTSFSQSVFAEDVSANPEEAPKIAKENAQKPDSGPTESAFEAQKKLEAKKLEAKKAPQSAQDKEKDNGKKDKKTPDKKSKKSILILPADNMRKGELSMLGMVNFLNPRNFAGIGIGYLSIDNVMFASISPLVELHFLKNSLHLAVGAPINLTLFDPNAGGFKAAGKIRPQDWDEWRDYFKILQRIQYGRKEDHLYLKLSRTGAATIGHGTLMRRYNNNLFANNTRLALEADAYNDYGGAELFIGDITFDSQVIAGLGFIKPLSFFMKDPVARSFSVGVSYVGDEKAPTSLKRDNYGVVKMDVNSNPLFNAQAMHGIGVDAEVKPLRIGDKVDLKTYFDFSKLVSYGEGFTFGLLGRFNFGRVPQGVRTRVEYTIMTNQFIPSYFDNFYEIQKIQFVNVNATTFAPTKIEYLKNLNSRSVRHNFYGEATYSVLDRFAVTVAYEVGTGQLQQNLLLHAEFSAFSWLRFFGSYHKRNFSAANQLFKFQQNDLLYGQVRLMVLPVLFINGRVYKSFVWDPSVDFGLGGLRNVWDYKVDVELGWQWK